MLSQTRIQRTPPRPFSPAAQAAWMLDPAIIYLNHGCFGARLQTVVAAQHAWRERFEARPVEMLDRRRNDFIAEAKETVGRFLGMGPKNFGFVTNATEGVNTILRSINLGAGDELLTTNHVYNAVRLTMQHVAEQHRARLVQIDLSLPISSEQEILDTVRGQLSERTRLLLLDEIASPTAVRFPVKPLVENCRSRGIEVLVDGAHAPGAIALDIESLGADYYTGNLHKWVGAPPGAAFLWVRPDRQPHVHPTVISHFLGEGLAEEFSWQGTRDISPWLMAKVAIEEMDRLDGPGSWPRIMQHNHEMAAWVQTLLCDAWGVEPTTPPDGSLLSSMTTVSLPEQARERFEKPEAFQARLYHEHAIEVPVILWRDAWWIRPSCQVYNAAEHYQRLADAVSSLLT